MYHMRGRKKNFLILILVLSFSIGGCDQLSIGKKQDQKPTAKAPPPAAPSQAAPSQPSESPQDSERNYVYNPAGKRDPFQPFIAAQSAVKPAGEEIPVTPLQKYDLSQLKLVAIMVGTGAGEGRAMLEDSEGKGYIIKKGAYVGVNYGKVTAVLKDRVIIAERYKDYTGQVKEKEIVLRLRPIAEGK
jgi:type IV pilus assembly protein PilP